MPQFIITQRAVHATGQVHEASAAIDAANLGEAMDLETDRLPDLAPPDDWEIEHLVELTVGCVLAPVDEQDPTGGEAPGSPAREAVEQVNVGDYRSITAGQADARGYTAEAVQADDGRMVHHASRTAWTIGDAAGGG